MRLLILDSVKTRVLNRQCVTQKSQAVLIFHLLRALDLPQKSQLVNGADQRILSYPSTLNTLIKPSHCLCPASEVQFGQVEVQQPRG
mmetsp:Transcript_7983/g.14225  ORF Transcript_7983/g.14225 Transcript_7983/m.14225 type:complete len:87 (-) Transcript_7983:148-408(-)